MDIGTRLAAAFNRKGAVLVAAVLVLGLADALSNIMGHTGLFALSPETSSLPVNGKIPFELGLLAMSLAVIAGGRLFARHVAAYNLGCSALLALGVFACQNLAAPSAAGGIAGLVVFGLGFIGAKFFGFYLLYLAADLKTVVMCIALEKLLKTGVASLVFLMAAPGQALCSFILAGVIIACLALACPWATRQPGSLCKRDDLGLPDGKRIAANPPRSMVGQAALASVVLGITQSFTPYGTYGAAPVQDAEHFAVYLAVASLVPLATWFVFVRGAKRSEERYRSAFMVVLGGLFVVSTQSDATWTLAPFVSALLLDFLEMFGHVVFDATVFPVWWARSEKTLAPIGGFMAVFSVAALAWIVFVQEAYAFAVLLALVAAYAGTVIVSKLLPRTTEAASVHRELVDDAYLRRIAETYGLSARETEVFLLLAQGRSRSYIHDQLSISEGTVKAHTSRIYQKLGVASKQEMISLVLDKSEGTQP